MQNKQIIRSLKNTINILKEVKQNLVDDNEIENLEQTIIIVNRQIEQIERRK